MDKDKEVVQSYFQYICKSYETILDSQYSHDGEFLAVATSTATLFVYRSQSEEDVEGSEQIPIAEYQSTNKNNSFLKVAWGLNKPSQLVVATIDREIKMFDIVKDKNNKGSLPYLVNRIRMRKFDNVATHMAFVPGQDALTVGFSSGKLAVLDAQFNTIAEVPAHEQSINWLAWEPRFPTSPINEWMTEYFPNHINISKDQSLLLATASSDNDIKIWGFQQGKLLLKQKISAHKKQVRQVMWRPNHFIDNSTGGKQSKEKETKEVKYLISCSEDSFVKFWEIKVSPKGDVEHKEKSSKAMKGPVYRAEYNVLGSVIAISYNKNDHQVVTECYRDNMGKLGEEIPMIK